MIILYLSSPPLHGTSLEIYATYDKIAKIPQNTETQTPKKSANPKSLYNMQNILQNWKRQRERERERERIGHTLPGRERERESRE